MEFSKPDKKARLAQLGYLVRHTFTVVGRNRALLTPLIAMWVYATAMVVVFFVGLFLVVNGSGGGGWFLFGGVLMFFYKYFYYNRAELTLSRLTYDTAIGGTPSHSDARRELAGLGSQVRSLAMLDMVATWVASRKNKEGGLMSLVLGGIGEVWDLVNHFMLPAVAIDKLGLRDGAGRLKRLKEHVPETLVGVFGVDIMGGVIGTLMAPFYVFGMLAAIVCGLYFGASLPEAFSAGALRDLSPDIPEIDFIGPDTVFNWLPVFLFVFLGFILQAVLARIVTAIKVVYFTLFYSRLMHPEALDPKMRTDLEGYLELEG